ncbi:aldehyde dehydrogenase family protein [Bradyrhizobium manausense]
MLALEAGLPAGVFNVVAWPGRVVADALVNHLDFDKVTFTGRGSWNDERRGRQIQARLARGRRQIGQTLSSTMPISKQLRKPRPPGSSPTPARYARPAPACWRRRGPMTKSSNVLLRAPSP